MGMMLTNLLAKVIRIEPIAGMAATTVQAALEYLKANGGGGGSFSWTPISATIGTTVNDFNPSGFGAGANSVTQIRLNPSSGEANVTGISMASAPDGAELTLTNIHATNGVRLQHANAGSLAAARFSVPNADDFFIPPLGSVRISKDGVSGVVRVLP